MAIGNLTLGEDPGYYNASNLVEIGTSSTPSDLYVSWTTVADYPSEWNDSFTLAVNWRYVPRGATGGNGGWSDWQNDNAGTPDGWFSAVFPASECSPTDVDFGTRWSVALSDIEGFLAHVAPLAFASRKYDALQLRIKCKANYASGLVDERGDTSSPVSQTTAAIVWVPDIEVTGAAFTLSNLVVTVETEGWDRPDSVYRLATFSQLGSASKASIGDLADSMAGIGGIVTGSPEARPDRDGNLAFPMAEFQTVPREGEARVSLWLSTDYAVQLAYFSGDVEVANNSKCNTPELSFSADDMGALTVTVTDSGDLGKPIVGSTVSLDGGGLSCDSHNVEPGGSAVFLPPFDVPLTFVCTAWGDDSASQVDEEADPVPSDGSLAITDTDGAGARLRYNVTASRTSTRECEELKLAGRDRSTVFFGTGATVTRTLGATVWDGSAEHAYVVSLDGARDEVVRLPGGDRFLGAAKSTTVTRGYRTDDVSITMTEVADGRLA